MLQLFFPFKTLTMLCKCVILPLSQTKVRISLSLNAWFIVGVHNLLLMLSAHSRGVLCVICGIRRGTILSVLNHVRRNTPLYPLGNLQMGRMRTSYCGENHLIFTQILECMLVETGLELSIQFRSRCDIHLLQELRLVHYWKGVNPWMQWEGEEICIHWMHC